MSSKSTSKNIFILIMIAVVMVIAIVGVTALINRNSKSNSQISYESAISQLEKKLKKSK